MQGAQTGRAQRTSSGTAWGTVIAVVVAIAVVAAVAYYIFAGGAGYAPNTPYQSAAPATGAPATGAPATPGTPRYP